MFTCSVLQPAGAQLPFIKRSLTESDGLLSNYVQSIFLDSKSKLWIGTDKGLSVYYGNRFLHYTAQQGLNNTYVNGIFEYQAANAVLAVTAGGGIYAIRDERLIPVEAGNNGAAIVSPSPNHFYYSKVIADTFNLYLVQPSNLQPLLVLQGVASLGQVSSITADHTLTLYNKLWRDSVYHSQINIQINESPPTAAFRAEGYYYMAGKGWIFSKQGVRDSLLLKDVERKWIHLALVKWNGENALLLNGYNSGDLALIKPGAKNLFLPAPQTRLPVITCLASTPEGNALLGTMGQGLVWVGINKAGLFLPGQQVQRVALRGSDLYATGDSALYVFSSTKGDFKPLPVKLSHATHLQVEGDTVHLTTLLNYRRFKISPQGNLTLLHAQSLSKGISGYASWLNNYYLLSTYSTGTYIINEAHQASREINSGNMLFPDIVEKIIPFSRGIVLTSYNDGATIVPFNGKAYQFSKKSGLPNNTVHHATLYGNAWHIGLEKAFQIRTPEGMQTFLPKHGVEGRRILYSFIDAKGRVFVVSEKRLMLVRNNRVAVLNSMPVTPSKEHTVIAAVFDSVRQVLWCGTTGGLLRLDIASFKLIDKQNQPYLAAMSGWKPSGDPSENMGRIDAAGLSFFIGHNYFNDFEAYPLYYRLKGLNNAWQTLPSERSLHVQHLPAGDYQLEVKTFSADGVPAPVSVLNKFTVLPPYYVRWYALVLYAVLFLLLGMRLARLIGNYRLRRQVRQYNLERKIQEERNRISGDLHDNVGSHLTTIIAQLDYVEGQLQQQRPADALKKVEQLQLKSRQVMTQLRESIWALHEDAVSIGQFMMKVQQYALTVFDSGMGVECQVEIPLEQGPQLSPWHAVNLLRVVQEACQNIQKHANAIRVDIYANATKEGFVLTIADNGQGISTAGNIRGHGMDNMKKRMESMGGRFEIVSSARGVTIEAFVPLHETGQMPQPTD